MANPEHLDILKQGVEVWNKWRKDTLDTDLYMLDLREIVLRNQEFNYYNFEAVDFYGADLSSSSFMGADFSYAFLEQAKLEQCNLIGAILVGTDMESTCLQNTKLGEAIFINLECRGTEFSGATLNACTFGNCDLSAAKGLEITEHITPSTIGIDTIYVSKGKIPEVFLRGCGVPDTFITYAKSLVDNPIEYYSCFISFTEKDDAFSERLYNDMQMAGIRCWRWKEDAKWGGTLRKEIDEAVRYYDKLVIICSKDSLNAPAVLEEIKRALNKEDSQGKEVLFPIMIDDYLLKEWDHYLKVRITDKIVGDFRDWNGDAEKYRKSVERLVRDLNRPRK